MKNFIQLILLVLVIAVSCPEDPASSGIQVLRDGLCKDKDGKLLFQTDASEINDGKIITSTHYLSKVLLEVTGELKFPELSSVVDEDSWKMITFAQYYHDKNRVYVFIPALPHGSLYVLGALKPNELKIMHHSKWLNVQDIPHKELNPKRRVHYTLQANVVCFNDEPISGADPATFKVIKDVSGLVIEGCATDRNNIYRGNKAISRDTFLEEALALALSNDAKNLEYAQAMAELIGGVSVK
jgi:hypothetical protein